MICALANQGEKISTKYRTELDLDTIALLSHLMIPA
jgi:hypothetical protein